MSDTVVKPPPVVGVTFGELPTLLAEVRFSAPGSLRTKQIRTILYDSFKRAIFTIHYV